MMDETFRLLHAVTKRLLGTKLPKARDVYTTYEGIFKGPNYDYIVSRIRKGEMKTYSDSLRHSMAKFIEYLKNN